MKDIRNILVPTDLSDNSRRAIVHGCALAAENQAALIVLHVANDLQSWVYHDDYALAFYPQRTWPVDRVLSEATLDLNRFIEPHLPALKNSPCVTKRVVIGSVAAQIVAVAENEGADLVIMSPRRDHKMRHWLSRSITDRVTRLCPCPVLSVTEPLPSRGWRGHWKSILLSWPRQRTEPLGA